MGIWGKESRIVQWSSINPFCDSAAYLLLQMLCSTIMNWSRVQLESKQFLRQGEPILCRLGGLLKIWPSYQARYESLLTGDLTARAWPKFVGLVVRLENLFLYDPGTLPTN